MLALSYCQSEAATELTTGKLLSKAACMLSQPYASGQRCLLSLQVLQGYRKHRCQELVCVYVAVLMYLQSQPVNALLRRLCEAVDGEEGNGRLLHLRHQQAAHQWCSVR